jgi:hypothetical protein
MLTGINIHRAVLITTSFIEKVAEPMTILACTRKVPGSDLMRDTNYNE